MPKNAIILIGPKGAGKTTLVRHLGMILKWPMRSLDLEAPAYYKTMPLIAQFLDKKSLEDFAVAETIISTRILAAIRSGALKQFQDERHFKEVMELHALKHFLQDHQSGVMELGAGQAIFEREESLNLAVALLKPFPNIIALFPDPNPQISTEILMRRLKDQGRSEPRGNVEYYANHQSYHSLAHLSVYTKDQKPKDTCRKILHLLEDQIGMKRT